MNASDPLAPNANVELCSFDALRAAIDGTVAVPAPNVDAFVAAHASLSVRVSNQKIAKLQIEVDAALAEMNRNLRILRGL